MRTSPPRASDAKPVKSDVMPTLPSIRTVTRQPPIDHLYVWTSSFVFTLVERFPVAAAGPDVHLTRLYRRLGADADACAEERWAETEEGLRQVALAFSQARLALGGWELSP